MPATASILDPLRRAFAAAPPDAELLRRYAAGDGEAFRALVERHGPLVLGVARRLTGEAHADDVFQATFLTLARSVGSVRSPAALPVWLHRTAYRFALAARRADRRRQTVERRHPMPPSRDPLDELSAREFLGILDVEIERLPERDRGALILCCLEECSLDEAAARLGVSRDSVKGRLERSRSRLRKNLARRGFTVSVALGAGLLLAPPAVAGPLLDSTLAVCLGAAPASAAAAALVAMPRARKWFALLTAMALAGIGVGWMAVAKAPAPPPANAPAAPRVDAHGDPLPDGAAARLGTERLRAAESALALPPDGKTIITVSKRTVVREWDAADGRLKNVRRLESQDYSHTVLSPDGKWFLGHASHGTDWDKVVIWEVASGKRVYSRSVNGQVKSAAFMPDGSGAFALLDGHGSSVFRADFRDGGWKELFALPFGYGQHVELSADGRKLAALADNGTLLCWDVAANKELWRQANAGRLFAFDPDSKSVLINPMAGKTLERRDAVTGKIIADDRLPPRLPQWGELEWLPRFALRVTPDGKGLLFHDRDKGMVLWDLAEGKERLRLPAGFVSNSRSAFTPDGRSLITLGPALQRWDFVPSRPLPSADQGAPGPGTLQRWDLATGRPQYADLASAGHTKPPDKLAFSPDGRRLLSISPDGTARLWDTATSGQVHTWRAHGGARVVAGAFRPDGDRVVTMGNDGYLRLWDAGSGKELRSVTFVDPKSDERPDAKHLLIAPGGKTAMAFAYQDGKYRLTRWNLSTGRTIGSRLLDRMIPSPDGRTAYRIDRQAGDEIRLTDIETGAVTAALKTIGPPGSVPFATHSDGFSDDGRLLAAKVEQAERGKQSGAFVQVWDTAGGPPLANIPAHVLNYINVAFSRDCRLLAFTDADAVRVWDLAAGRELWRRADPARTAVSLAFAPDGRTLAAGCDDTTILLWTLPQPDTGKPIAAGEREVVWTQLASPDAAAAHVAMWRLTDDPKTAVPLLRERLIGTPVAADVVRPLLADLSATEFRTREAAERRLRDLGAGALPDLRSARKAEQRPEAKRRLDALLAPYEGDDHRRRTNRAAAVLQRIGTPDARRVLASLNAPE